MKRGYILKRVKRAINAVALVCSLIICNTFFGLPANADEDIVVSVCAHRGYSSQYPENTLSSLAGAVAAGVRTVEFDVRQTKDKKLVIFHDDTLEKFTGDDSRVEDYTYEELLQLDVGSWYDSKFYGERIPTLDQALDILEASNVRMFVEIKNRDGSVDYAMDIFNTCAAHGVLDRVVFSCFNYDLLLAIKEVRPEQPIMVLASFGKSNLPAKYPAEYYGINMKTLTPKTIQAIHEAGSLVYSYTPVTRRQVLSLQRLGVDGIITDDARIAEN